MTANVEAPRRRLWPFLAAAVLALPVLYVLSDGVGIYAVERGWIDFQTFMSIWGPLPELFSLPVVDLYERWWCELARRHGGEGVAP